jgi:hypothetical protein
MLDEDGAGYQYTKEDKERIMVEYAQKIAENRQEKETKQPAATDWAGQNKRHFWYHTGQWDVSSCLFYFTLLHRFREWNKGIAIEDLLDQS